MFEPLSEAAQEDYFSLVRMTWKSELISSSELHKRLRVLDDMRGREASWTYNPVWARQSDCEYEKHLEGIFEAPCLPSTNHQDWDDVEPSGGGTPVLHLVIRLAKGEWIFYKGDPDPYPSVPHGHGTLDERRKLDAYLGYIYIGGIVDGRLTKTETINLWNDDKFRRFAQDALEHFLAQNPKHSFRVRNPRKLPRKR